MCELMDPKILVTDNKIENVNDLIPLLEVRRRRLRDEASGWSRVDGVDERPRHAVDEGVARVASEPLSPRRRRRGRESP